MRKRFNLKRLGFLCLCAYACVVAGVYIFQRQLMYHPDKSALGAPSDYGVIGFEEIGLKPYYKTDMVVRQSASRRTQDAGRKAFSWWSEPPTKNAPVAIYFHGNAENISTRPKRMNELRTAGFGVLGVNYTGFASSKRARDYDNRRANPTEHMLYEDARAAIHFLHSQGIADQQIILIGESLGTGVATQMATEISPRAVILDCPFTSVAARSQEIYWWLPAYFMVWDRYDNATKIKKVKAPTLIIGAQNDTVVPVHHAKDLAALGGANVHLSVYENMGHVGLPADQFAAIVRAFSTSIDESAPHDKTNSASPR